MSTCAPLSSPPSEFLSDSSCAESQSLFESRSHVEESAEKSAAEELKQRRALAAARKGERALLAHSRARDMQRIITQCA